MTLTFERFFRTYCGRSICRLSGRTPSWCSARSSAGSCPPTTPILVLLFSFLIIILSGKYALLVFCTLFSGFMSTLVLEFSFFTGQRCFWALFLLCGTVSRGRPCNSLQKKGRKITCELYFLLRWNPSRALDVVQLWILLLWICIYISFFCFTSWNSLQGAGCGSSMGWSSFRSPGWESFR